MIFDIKIVKADIIRAAQKAVEKGRYFNGKTFNCDHCFFHFLIDEARVKDRLPCTYCREYLNEYFHTKFSRHHECDEYEIGEVKRLLHSFYRTVKI